MQSQDTLTASKIQVPPATVAISFTTVTAPHPVTKRIGIVDDRPAKIGLSPPLSSGVARRIVLTSAGATPQAQAQDLLAQFGQHLEAYGPNDVAIMSSVLGGPDTRALTTALKLPATPGAVARNKETFVRPAGEPGFMLLDFDPPYPDHILARLMQVTGPRRMLKVLASVAPCFGSAASLERISSSGRVRDRRTGKTMNGGMHLFFAVKDESLIPAATDRLVDLLMWAEFGFYSVDAAGRPHRKAIIDESATKSPERVVFEAPPVIVDETGRLEIDAEAQKAKLFPGEFLDLEAIPTLTDRQREELAQRDKRERERVADDIARIRPAYIARRTAEQRVAGSKVPVDAETFTRAIEHGELGDAIPLKMDDGRTVTVADVRADPAAFHGLTLADPLEPDYGAGRDLAIIYSDKAPIQIFSHAHGGINYRIPPGVERWFETDAQPRDIFADAAASRVLDMPVGCLPVLEPFVRDVSERLGVPQAYVLAAALAVVAGAIGTKLHLQVKQHDDSWTVPAILFVAIVGPVGANKTGALAQATNPLSRIDARKGKDGAERWAAWSERKKATKRGQVFNEPEPKIERHVTDDATMEGLGVVLADNPYGVLAVVDELTGWFGSFDSYKAAAKGADRALALRLFEGREARVDRVGRRHLYIPSWASSVVGGIQTEKIKELIRQGLDNDGLLQRFIPVMWDGEPRPSVDRPPDRAALAAYEQAIAQLADTYYVMPETIQMSPEAHDVWRPLAKRLSALGGLPGVGDAWAAHVNKWPGIAARLLLLSHVLANLGEGLSSVDRIPVSADTASRTLKLVDWLLSNSLRFYTECVGAGQAGEDARWIAGYILSRGRAGIISRRDIGQARRELRDDPLRVVNAMRFLEAADWCVAEDEERVDKFGPSRWTISPLVNDGRFASRATAEASRRAREREKIAAAAAERRRLLDGMIRDVA